MKILITTGIVLVAALVTGCAPQTQAQRDMTARNTRLAETTAQASACSDKINSTPSAEIVHSQVLFKDQASANRLELMASTKRTTPEQIEALKAFIRDAMPCRQIFLTGRAGTAYNMVDTYYFDAIDGVYLKLLKGEMTIGEANVAKDTAQKKATSAAQAVSGEINRNAAIQNQQELDQRQQNALMLMPYLMQQPVFTPQPYVVQPAYVPPRQINTNCQTYGNTTNCTSR